MLTPAGPIDRGRSTPGKSHGLTAYLLLWGPLGCPWAVLGQTCPHFVQHSHASPPHWAEVGEGPETPFGHQACLSTGEPSLWEIKVTCSPCSAQFSVFIFCKPELWTVGRITASPALQEPGFREAKSPKKPGHADWLRTPENTSLSSFLPLA